MRLLLRPPTKGWALVRRSGGSLDLKCYCFNALTDEGMRAVSSLTALTSLELWGCSEVTGGCAQRRMGWSCVLSVQTGPAQRHHGPN